MNSKSMLAIRRSSSLKLLQNFVDQFMIIRNFKRDQETTAIAEPQQRQRCQQIHWWSATNSHQERIRHPDHGMEHFHLARPKIIFFKWTRNSQLVHSYIKKTYSVRQYRIFCQEKQAPISTTDISFLVGCRTGNHLLLIL